MAWWDWDFPPVPGVRELLIAGASVAAAVAGAALAWVAIG